MDLVDEKMVHYASDPCADCGSFGAGLRRIPAISDLKLCTTCLEERHATLDDLRNRVREKFELSRSPRIRSCFLRLLLCRELDLAPGGWRAAMALGLELKGAGFGLSESRRILLHAQAKADLLDRLLDLIYKKKEQASLTCEQIRGLDLICEQCPGQYHVAAREQMTEIC